MNQPPLIKRRRSEKEGMQRILLAARDEFCRAGLAGAKLDVIAMEGGISKQLIHHYFRTKEELYVAVMDDVSASAIEGLSILDYENYQPQQALQLFLQGLFDMFVRWPFMVGLFNDQSLYGGEHIPECKDLMARSPALTKRLLKILTLGQLSGVFKTDIEPDAVLSAAMMITIGYFTHGKNFGSVVALDFSAPENINFWREFSVKFVLDALRP